MGDCNVIVSAEEKASGSSPNNRDMEEFNDALYRSHLTTINFDGSLFTWTNGSV